MARPPLDIRRWPPGERPRERLLAGGPDDLSDAELLAVLLGTGDARSGRNALDAGRELLTRFGGLSGLRRAGLAELAELPGVGPVKVARILAALELGRRLHSHPSSEPLRLTCSLDVYRAYRGRLQGLLREVFMVVLLDARNRRIRELRISEGGLTSAVVHPREVLSPAIRESAAALLCLHNHPSGDPTPSAEDIDLTHRLCAAGELVGIPLLDHVVIGSEGYVSLADQGFMGRRRAGRGWGGGRMEVAERRPQRAALGMDPPEG